MLLLIAAVVALGPCTCSKCSEESRRKWAAASDDDGQWDVKEGDDGDDGDGELFGSLDESESEKEKEVKSKRD